MGPLMRGPRCHLSILRNGNVPCHYFKIFPVDFKIVQYCLSILGNDNGPYLYFLNVPVDFKVVQCRLLNLRKRCVALSMFRVKGPIYDESSKEIFTYQNVLDLKNRARNRGTSLPVTEDKNRSINTPTEINIVIQRNCVVEYVR